MCIVTISRGSFSGARALAEGVAERLEVPCVSREIIVDAAQRAGISAESIGAVLDRPPSFFERVARECDRYMSYVKAALYQRAAAGSFVYHGHCGQFILGAFPDVLRIRVVAPPKMRTEAVQAELGMTKRRARRHIANLDARRAKWTRFLYGVDWTDPQLYDVVVNLERVTMNAAVDTVVRLARSRVFAASEAQRREAADRALAQSVTAELTRLPEAQAVGLRIEAHEGTIVLRGTAQYDDLRRSIVELVESVPGVEDVRCEITMRGDVLRT